MKYLTGIKHFFQLCDDLKLDWISMTAIQLADVLLVSSLSKSSDPSAVGGKHLIKAMRWLSKTAVVSVLSIFYDKIISSFLNTKKPSDRQETCPLMLHSIVHFQRRILQQQPSENEVLFLGACLLACWGGLRVADKFRICRLLFERHMLSCKNQPQGPTLRSPISRSVVARILWLCFQVSSDS